jgi:hypothetical protein
VIAHFAYGSNMSRAVMRKHAPNATALGVAMLADHRFLITTDGYASVERKRGAKVYGVVWRLTPRDYVTLAAWENTSAGLYGTAMLPVPRGGPPKPALIFWARPRPPGLAKARYMELVIAAALEWRLPQAYIASLQYWLPKRQRSVGFRELEEFEWT